MARNNAVKKQKEIFEDDFDFTEMEHTSHDDEVMAGIMSGMIEASNNQMLLALELTKLALDKTTKEMNEDDVFITFKKASGVIAERFPLHALWEKFTSND